MRSLTVKEVAAISRLGIWRVSRNLYVQVSPTGTKSWVFRYMQGGRAHGMGLGSLELVTLAEARDKALVCRKILLDGVDPLEERRGKRMQTLLAAAGKITFRTCAERYIEAHAAGWRNGKHRQQWRNMTYAYLVIGVFPTTDIDTGRVLEIFSRSVRRSLRPPPGSAAGSRASSTGRRHVTTGRGTRLAGAAISTSCYRRGARCRRSSTTPRCPTRHCRLS
jgi:hypothetical protein